MRMRKPWQEALDSYWRRCETERAGSPVERTRMRASGERQWVTECGLGLAIGEDRALRDRIDRDARVVRLHASALERRPWLAWNAFGALLDELPLDSLSSEQRVGAVGHAVFHVAATGCTECLYRTLPTDDGEVADALRALGLSAFEGSVIRATRLDMDRHAVLQNHDDAIERALEYHLSACLSPYVRVEDDPSG
jgi:hypothetical protein